VFFNYSAQGWPWRPANPTSPSALAPPHGGAFLPAWSLPFGAHASAVMRRPGPGLSAQGQGSGNLPLTWPTHYREGAIAPGPGAIPAAAETSALQPAVFCRECFLMIRRRQGHVAGFSINALGFARLFCCLTEHSNLDWLKAHGPLGPA